MPNERIEISAPVAFDNSERFPLIVLLNDVTVGPLTFTSPPIFALVVRLPPVILTVPPKSELAIRFPPLILKLIGWSEPGSNVKQPLERLAVPKRRP